MTLKTKILLSTLLISTLLNLSLTLYRNRQERNRHLAELNQEIAATNLLLNSVNAGPLYDGDENKLLVNLQSFFVNPNMIRIELSEFDGDINISQSRSLPDAKGAILESSAFITLQGDTLGEVTTHYSTSNIELDLKAWQKLAILQTLALLIFLWVFLSFLISRFTSPIVKLTQVATAMASGELDQNIDTRGSDEVATLAKNFDAMRKSIRDVIEDLAATNANLGQEIKKRISAATALIQSEENLRITLDSIGDAVIATDSNGKVTQMNPIAEILTGWTIADAVGLDLPQVFNIINAETRESMDNPVSKVLQSGRVIGLANHTVLVAKDGQERQIADSGAPIRNKEGGIVGVVLVFRDVTNEYHLQEQLAQAQKMDAIGKLAGGIAHDFNNLLTGILGNVELLLMDLPQNSEDADFAREIETASKRASDLTHQLLAFSRKGNLQSVHIDVNTLIKEVITLLQRSIDPRIQIKTEGHATNHFVTGDPSQLQSAILNLALNARDAMPLGGELSFITRNVNLDEGYCNKQGLHIETGEYLELAVTDTGVGMTLEVQKHIFEPFFTTKERGQGTGLGLAGVYGCVQSHHGAIIVYSEVGVGSTFRVLLPVAETPAGNISSPKVKPIDPVHGQGHILVIDDEEIIRKLAINTLGHLGYSVATAEDGLEGLKYFRENHNKIDLVILDLIMPNLGGEDTFLRIREIDPEARVLIASGFSSSAVTNALLANGALGLLNKPFNIEELSRNVAKHIGR